MLMYDSGKLINMNVDVYVYIYSLGYGRNICLVLFF